MPTHVGSAAAPEHTVLAGTVSVTGGIAPAFAPPTSIYFAAQRPGKSVFVTVEFVGSTTFSEQFAFDVPDGHPSTLLPADVAHPVHPELPVVGQLGAAPTSTASRLSFHTLFCPNMFAGQFPICSALPPTTPTSFGAPVCIHCRFPPLIPR